jgi:hypothetical protein
MNKLLLITILCLMGLISCSKKDSNTVTPKTDTILTVTNKADTIWEGHFGVFIVYLRDGNIMFTDSTTARDMLSKVSVVPLTYYTKFLLPMGIIPEWTVPVGVSTQFSYISVLDSGYLKQAYVLSTYAFGVTDSSFLSYEFYPNITFPNTAEVGIKWPDGQMDTLIIISDIYSYNKDTAFYKTVKCIYNNVVKYDITNTNAIIRNTAITIDSIPGLPKPDDPVIVVEK